MKGKKEYSLMNEEGFNEAVKEAYTVVFDEMVVRFYSLRDGQLLYYLCFSRGSALSL
jgi:hypothetical protein